MYYENNNLIAITSNNEYPCPKDITCKGTNKLSINLKDKSYSLIMKNEKSINYPDVFDNYFLVPGEKYVFGQKNDFILENGIIISYKQGFMSPVNHNKPKISFDDGKNWTTIKSKIVFNYNINGYNSDRPIYVNKNKMVYVTASAQQKARKKKSYKHKYRKKHKPNEGTLDKNSVYLYKMPVDDIDTNSEKYVLSKLDPLCSRIISNISSDDTIYLSCINGDLIKSTDDAKTWQMVYENK